MKSPNSRVGLNARLERARAAPDSDRAPVVHMTSLSASRQIDRWRRILQQHASSARAIVEYKNVIGPTRPQFCDRKTDPQNSC